MRALGVIVVFALGLAVGWSLHDVSTDWSSDAVYQKGSKGLSSPIASLSSEESSANFKGAISPAPDDITALFEQGNHKEILRRLGVARDSGSDEYLHLKKQLVNYLQQVAQDGQLARVQDLLSGAREILPQEPRLLYLAAELAVAQEDFLTAIVLFFELRDSRQELFHDRQVNQRLNLIIDAYRHRLQKQKQDGDLLKLYQLVTARDPTRPEFFYELAKHQYKLRNLEQARSSLSYVLSDQVWGKRAQELMAQIDRFEMLQTEYHSQIPLRRSGKHFLLTSLINGIHEVTLLLDTGASFTTLQPKLLTDLGLNQSDSPPVALETSGGRITAQLYNATTIAVGDQMISNAVIAGVSLGPNTKADGLLGMNFLSRFEFFIDQESAVLYLKPRIQ